MACCGGGREADEDARLDALLTGHSLGRSVTIAEPERRGITLRQLQRTLTAARARCKSEQWRDGDKPITAEKMSVADVRHRLVQPIVKNTLVEHLARGPQLPSWVVITSWRTPFAELVACLEQHTADHLLDESTTYWLSAFALSPRAGRHDSAELSARAAGLPAKVEEIPFHTALRAASRGALTVVDSAGRTFTDAWLGFEVFTTVASLPASLRHDWYVSPRGAKRPVGLVDGFAAGDKAASSSPDGWLDAKARRESAFPVEIAEKALQFSVSTATSDVPADAAHVRDLLMASFGVDARTLDATVRAHLCSGLLGRVLLATAGVAGIGLVSTSTRLDARVRNAIIDALRHSRITRMAVQPRSDVLLRGSTVQPGLPDSLQSLRLSGLDESVAPRLGQLVAGRALTHLEVRECALGPKAAAGLAKGLHAPATALTTLDVESNRLADAGAASLAKALAHNAALTRLDLRKNLISDKGAAALAEMLRTNTSISTLHLGDNELGPAAGAALASGLEANRALAVLDLSHNGLTDAGAVPLARALRANAQLTTLGLSVTLLTDEAAVELAAALGAPGCALRTLVLSHNKIGNRGGVALAEAIRAGARVERLNLGDNQLSDEAVSALGRALGRSKSLQTLNLWYNYVADPGARALAEGVRQNKSLTMLDLTDNNELTYDGKRALTLAWAHSGRSGRNPLNM